MADGEGTAGREGWWKSKAQQEGKGREGWWMRKEEQEGKVDV